MHPDCVKEFVTEFHKEMNRLAATQDTERDRLTRDLVKTENDIKKLIEAIKEGVPGSAIKDELQTLEDRRQELTYALEHSHSGKSPLLCSLNIGYTAHEHHEPS